MSHVPDSRKPGMRCQEMGEESFNEGGILWSQSIQITSRNIPVLPFTKQPPPDKEEILGIGLKYILSDKEGDL